MRLYILILSIGLCLFGSLEAVAQKQSTSKKEVSSTVISCGVCNQKAVLLPKPEYPAAARYVNASGEVRVLILIDEVGDVISANAVTGNPLLRPASERAALRARFQPVRLGKRKVQVQGTIVYNYTRPNELPVSNR